MLPTMSVWLLFQRYYSSAMGRFMTPDWAAKPTAVPYASFGNPQSLNLYSYVKNNPTTVRDPDGHCGFGDCAIPAIFVGAAIVVSAAYVGTEVYLHTPSTQRSIDTFSSAASANISANISAVKSTISRWFSKSSTGGGTQPKDIYIDPNKYPASAGHIADAQAAGHPDVLTVQRPGSDARGRAATAGRPTQPGTDRDEYPPKSTQEGGAGASVRDIPSSDNRGGGASFGNQIRDVPNGGQIRVIPKPKPGSPEQ